MERSKLVISIVVGIAAVIIIWRVGFYPPVPEPEAKPAETEVAAEPGEPGEGQKPGDANEPVVASDVNEPGKLADVNEPGKVVAAAEPNEPMEAVNLKDVQMKDIIKKLADWTGKTIIPADDESMKQKITIYAPKKLPRSKALAMIYSALRLKGYIAERSDDTIYLKPIKDAKLGEVPTIPDDVPLAMIENKDQVVQKFFKLKNYGPTQMGDIIQKLIGEYGFVGVDETTSTLLIIDTVKNLIRFEKIVAQFDEAEAVETVKEIFQISYGDASEIVQLLETLLIDERSSITSQRGPSRGRGFRPPGRGGTGSGESISVTVGIGRTPATLIAEPKNNWIIAKATAEDIKLIGEWIKKLDKPVSTILVDVPLAQIQNKSQVVQKFFKLKNYSPQQMSEVIKPLLGESGHVSGEENTGNLLVIDTVENLMRYERIITEFDVPEAEQTVWDIFQIYNGDPSEIVQLLRMLLSAEGTGGATGRSVGYSRSSSYSSYGRGGMSYYPSRSSYRAGSSSPAVMGTSQFPIVLIPEPKRRWIIARASAEDMKRIGEWIDKLDKKEPIKQEYETVTIGYADVSEVASRLNEALQQMPGSELQESVLIQPLIQARQIVIFGREDMREMVKKLIAEVDIPAGMFETRVFKLKNADPDEIKTNLEGLYEQQAGSFYSYSYSYSGSSRRSRDVSSQETVRVISFPTMQQVTVIASPENMVKIAQQIEEWDVPLDVAQVKPLIIELHNSDPIEMADLLSTLFSEESARSMSFWDIYYGTQDDKKKIVGPLYGQLTFADVPGTSKIIVISKIPEAYKVIKELVLELDRQEMAQVPRVVTLKYADPEDLSERLNAMFNEPGTSARIRLSEQGLSEDPLAQSEQGNQGSSGQGQGQDTTSQGEYTPWWSQSGARSRVGEEVPISNVIGRIRFVPDPHTKSILVLAPPEFIDEVEKLIQDLDIPGKQVLIKAIIVEIEHSSATSLGVQLSTNPDAFGAVGENAILALSNLTHLATHGTATGTIATASPLPSPIGATGTGTVLAVGSDLYALIDFLVKKTNAKILNQQSLWTKDNEQAMFFKGKNVAFLASESITTQTTTQNVTFEDVGMTLQARPSITPEKDVDMNIRVNLSQLTTELVNDQPVRSKMRSETNMIVQDGQTIMLGGILFQTESIIERKVPLFGDVPVVGGLFRHNQSLVANSELIIFITPYVIEDSESIPPETKEKIEKLDNIKEQLETTMDKLEQELP